MPHPTKKGKVLTASIWCRPRKRAAEREPPRKGSAAVGGPQRSRVTIEKKANRKGGTADTLAKNASGTGLRLG